MYPSLVTTTTTCSLGIILVVSTFISSNSSLISVLLGIPYSFFIFLKSSLVKEYSFTDKQAEAIVNLQLYRLTNTDVVLLEEEMKKLEEKIKLYEDSTDYWYNRPGR